MHEQLSRQANHPVVRIFDLNGEEEIVRFVVLSETQDVSRFKALRRSLHLAEYLISEKGLLILERIEEVRKLLKTEGYAHFENEEALLWEWFLHVLEKLERPSLQFLLKQFRLPLFHARAEELIRYTLGLREGAAVQERHLKVAVLSALFCPLRQNIGSCFATAPAILIQSEQIEQCLKDLQELLTGGKMVRVIEGRDYVVPMSLSIGQGDLRRPLEGPHSQRRLLYSPGLLLSLVQVGILTKEKPIAGLVDELEKLCADVLDDRQELTIEKLLIQAVCSALSISKEMLDVEDAPPNPFQHQMEMGGKRGQIEEAKRKIERAKALFLSFVDHPLLKSWEYTIASYSEAKMDFTQWNLYVSLGFDPKEEGGIGRIVYQFLEEKLQRCNQKIEEYQRQLEGAFDQVERSQLYLKRAENKEEARRLYSEYTARYHHFRSLEELRFDEQRKAKEYSQLFSEIIKLYIALFPDHFQEIFDPEMRASPGQFYDDAPAGFRLIYKHGRTNPGVWSFIYDRLHYIRSLVHFFTLTESDLMQLMESEQGKREIGEISTRIIQWIQSSAFFESACRRAASAHRMRGEIQSKTEEPWCYLSGGSLDNLLAIYFKQTAPFKREERWVESEVELLVFILDVLKMIPPSSSEGYVKDPRKRMLISSPTHAFSLLPGLSFLRRGWEDSGFSYTWARDELYIRGRNFYQNFPLEEDQQQFLSKNLLSRFALPSTFNPPSTIAPLPIFLFRETLLDALPHSKKRLAPYMDQFLYESIPLISPDSYQFWMEKLLAPWMDERLERLIESRKPQKTFYIQREFRMEAKTLLLMRKESLFSPHPIQRALLERAREIGIAPPEPLIFGDTNWTSNLFAFVFNPGTDLLELWRVDFEGETGVPMTSWKKWMDGSSKETWTIYYNPHQYTIG